jgi:hypothetical protein
MTRDQIEQLTDAELVAAVARGVMGWSVITPSNEDNWLEKQTKGMKFPVLCMHSEGGRWLVCKNPEIEYDLDDKQWWPESSWDDCWEVVEAMRAKEWKFDLIGWMIDNEDCKVSFYREWNDPLTVRVRCSFGDERRAILRAALAAMGAKEAAK